MLGLLRSNVEYASKLLTGRKEEESIFAQAPTSNRSRTASSDVYSLAFQCVYVWVLPNSHKHPILQCQRAGAQNSRYVAGKGEVLSHYIFGCYMMARLKHGPRRPETRHKSCPIQSCIYLGRCCSAVSLHFRGMRFPRLNTPIYVLKYSHSSLNYQK